MSHPVSPICQKLMALFSCFEGGLLVRELEKVFEELGLEDLRKV